MWWSYNGQQKQKYHFVSLRLLLRSRFLRFARRIIIIINIIISSFLRFDQFTYGYSKLEFNERYWTPRTKVPSRRQRATYKVQMGSTLIYYLFSCLLMFEFSLLFQLIRQRCTSQIVQWSKHQTNKTEFSLYKNPPEWFKCMKRVHFLRRSRRN